MAPSVSYENTQLSESRIPSMNMCDEENKENVCCASLDQIKKSGIISIKTGGASKRNLTVCAKVYNNGIDHFILFTSKSMKNTECMNLRNTHIEKVAGNSLRITPAKGIDIGQSMTIIPAKDIDSWLEVLTDTSATKVSNRKRRMSAAMLPTLQECDES